MALFASHSRTFIGTLGQHTGETVCISGWIASKRDHGKVVFLDIKDSTGKIQTVTTSSQDFFTAAQEAKEQSAVTVCGTVAARPEKLRTDEPNGDIELQITAFEIVNTERRDL